VEDVMGKGEGGRKTGEEQRGGAQRRRDERMRILIWNSLKNS
jgi:hypothetical protein